MLRIALAAAGLAAAVVAGAAQAQPYYEAPTPYPNEDLQTSRSADDYGKDASGYDTDRGYDQDADGDADNGRQHFTGRVGAAWYDADGRRCRWREVERRDPDGYRSTKWVTFCRE